MIEWDDLRYLLAIERSKTLTGAARRLDVNHTTVGRRLTALEAGLGTRLFNRIDNRLVPTLAGEIVVRRAREIEAVIQGTTAEVAGRDDSLSGKVRLTSVSLIINLLANRLGEFARQYPDIELHLLPDQQNLALDKLEADVALRVARPTEPSAVTRRVGTIKFGVFAARRYAPRADKLPWIGYSDSIAKLPEAQWLEQQLNGERPFARVADAPARMSALSNSPCRALLPFAMVPHDSDLVLLSGPRPVISRDVWLVYMKALRKNARIAAVSRWAAEICSRALA